MGYSTFGRQKVEGEPSCQPPDVLGAWEHLSYDRLVLQGGFTAQRGSTPFLQAATYYNLPVVSVRDALYHAAGRVHSGFGYSDIIQTLDWGLHHSSGGSR